MKKMSLRELLSYIDFDYEIENSKIKLVDLQDVYLGSIADFRVELNDEYAVCAIIDRMKIYWNDYVISDLEEDLNVDKYKNWEELYKIAQEKYNEDVNKCTILGYLVDCSNVYIEEKGE